MQEDELSRQAAVIRILVMCSSTETLLILKQVIQEQPDLVLVGQVADRLELLVAVTAEVDILIMEATHTMPSPGICSHLFSEYPELKIIVLATKDKEAALYWRGIRRNKLAQPSSPTALLKNIRRSYRLNPTL